MGFFPDLCSAASKADLLSKKREISVDVFQERGYGHSVVQGDVNLWSCLIWRVAGSEREAWEGDVGMWIDPKEERSGVLGVLACKKWVQGKGWMVFSWAGREQGA